MRLRGDQGRAKLPCFGNVTELSKLRAARDACETWMPVRRTHLNYKESGKVSLQLLTRAVLGMVVLAALIVACSSPNEAVQLDGGQSTPSDSITAEQANEYVGSRKTVCGEVGSPTYARGSRGQPTFLNLDRPYPNQVFTVVIWGRNRDAFPSAPEQLYSNSRICVTGLIETYQGLPQIMVTEPRQITKTND